MRWISRMQTWDPCSCSPNLILLFMSLTRRIKQNTIHSGVFTDHDGFPSISLPSASLGQHPFPLGEGVRSSILRLHLVTNDMGHRVYYHPQGWMGMRVPRRHRLCRGNDVHVLPRHEPYGLGIPRLCSSRGNPVVECILGLSIQRRLDLDCIVVELHGSRWNA
jgi:hypothetical protein